MSATDAEDLLITRGEGLMEAEIDGEMVALHVENGTCYSFNPTAYRIWQLIAQPTTLGRVCTTLAELYDVDAATCEADVRAVLDDLAADGLVSLGAR